MTAVGVREPYRRSTAVLSEVGHAHLLALIARYGSVQRAAILLRSSPCTIENARAGVAIQAATMQRLEERLAVEAAKGER